MKHYTSAVTQTVSQTHPMTHLPYAKTTLALLAALSLTACARLDPQPLTEQALTAQAQADHESARQDVQPIVCALTLDEAMARALKYNLDRRARMLEEALAFQQYDASRYDMLPKLLAQAGYTSRNNDKISQSRNAEDGSLSESRFISQERDHTVSSLALSWNMLDLGVGCFPRRATRTSPGWPSSPCPGSRRNPCPPAGPSWAESDIGAAYSSGSGHACRRECIPIRA